LNYVVIIQTFSGDKTIHQAGWIKSIGNAEPEPSRNSPRNLVAVAATDFVQLYWQAPAPPIVDFEGYIVYRDGARLFEDPILDILTYRDDDVEAGPYTYHVVAVYGHGISLPSNDATATPGVIIDSHRNPPRNLIAIPGVDFVRLNWQAPAAPINGLLGYVVYRDDERLFEEPMTVLTYLDEEVEDGVSYIYQVIAVYLHGYSVRSNDVPATPGVPTELVKNPPRDLTHVIGDNYSYIRLSWQAPEPPLNGFDGYIVYRDSLPLFDEPIMELEYEYELFLAEEYPTFTLVFHVRAIYEHGYSVLSNPATVTIEGTNSTDDDVVMAQQARLGNNFPNPFNPTTVIYFELHKASDVKLEIWNVRGQRVRTLVNSSFTEGRHYVHWDGTYEGGVRASSGVYLYRLETDSFTDVKRMLLLK
jgi:hypothetical protein